MPRVLRFLLPFILLAGFTYLAFVVKNTPPSIQKRAVAAPQIAVVTETVKATDFIPQIPSYGRVQPRTKTDLVAQVSGQIIETSVHFRNGGYVQKGEVLVRIDPVDYQVAIDIAKGDVADAELALAEEEARGAQARKDWSKIGGLASASKLALRVPQLQAAKARLTTAKAQLRQAKVNLKRTEIRAPYDGRLLSTSVDLGTVIVPQVVLATLYATDYVEVRLPIKNTDLTYLNLPNASERAGRYRYPAVEFSNSLVTPVQPWVGRVVRAEGAIDASSQQLYVVAQIDDPFRLRTEKSVVTEGHHLHPLKVGQYLSASIEGALVTNQVVIPGAAIYQGSYVYLVKMNSEKNNVLIRQEIHTGFQGQGLTVITEGLQVGDELVLTHLGQVASGTAVTRVNSVDASGSAP